jgi:hypothetical protein
MAVAQEIREIIPYERLSSTNIYLKHLEDGQLVHQFPALLSVQFII